MVEIGTDWFVEVKCPRPNKGVQNENEHIRACMGCIYAVWERPEMVAGFMRSMCGVRVSSIGMAASLDSIAERLAGITGFTEKHGQIEQKLAVLRLAKSHAEKGGWRFESMSKAETLRQLDVLIEFCERAKARRLEVWVWA